MQGFEPTDQPPDAGPLARRALSLVLQTFAVCAALWPMLRGEFVYDDLWLVAQNPNLASFRQMWHSLGGSYWDFIDARSAMYVGYWRPMTTLTLYFGSAVGQGSPAAFHAISLCLHIVAVALCTTLAWRLTRDPLLAFFVGLLFGLHPVQVEAVSWISSVNDPLAGVFSFGALLAFLTWRERGSKGRPLAAAGLFLCALLSKESALAVLPLALAIDLGRRPGSGSDEPLLDNLRPFVRPFATLFAAFAIYYAARIVVFGDIWAGFDRSTGQLGLTLARKVGLRIEFFGGALGLMSWPEKLNFFRDIRPEIPWNDAQLWIAVLCIALWTAAVIVCWRKRLRPHLSGLLVIPAACLPALLRIEALGRFSLSDRYLYVAVFGFCLFAVAALSQLAARLSLKYVGLFTLALLALVLGWRARDRTHVWQDERTLFGSAYRDNPNNPYVAWGLGRVMLQDYRRSMQIEFLKEAKADFEHSLELGLKGENGERDLKVLVTGEDRLQANLGLGWSYLLAAKCGFEQTSFEEALAIFEKVVSFFPKSYEAITGTGVVLMEQGELAQAREKFHAALDINPKHLEAWYYLGKLELRRRDLAAARTAFERALELKADDVDTLPLYAGVLAELGETASAQRALDLAQRLAPDDPGVLMELGMLAARNHEGGAALAWFDRLLKISPTYGPAYLQKGKVLIAMNQTERGIPALEKACELGPRDFESHYTLGVLLLNQGLGKEALPFLQRALDLEPNNPLADALREQVEKIKSQ
jgi:tetratricopeptide (TPR) repeat protein